MCHFTLPTLRRNWQPVVRGRCGALASWWDALHTDAMADVVEIHETQDDFEVDEEGDRKLHYIPFTYLDENLHVCNILLYDQK